MRAGRLALCAALLLAGCQAQGGAEGGEIDEVMRTVLEHRQLLTNCARMWLVVEHLGDDAGKIGLSEQSLTDAGESRLRAARLYSAAERVPYLYIRVSVVGRAFSVDVQFNQEVFTLAGTTPVATTWVSSSTGTHGGDGGYIRNALAEHLDKFVAAYLRVNNEDSCPAPEDG